MEEKCKTPFLKRKKCESTDIFCSIMYKGEELVICHNCWKIISKSDAEWGNEESRRIEFNTEWEEEQEE